MSDRKLARKREAPLTDLTKLMFADPDAKLAVTATLKRTGIRSLGELARLKPKVFDDLHEGLMDLNDQAPREVRPGFLS